MEKNRTLALAGIMTAFTVIILFFAMVIPNLKLVLYGLSSLPIAVILIECDKKTAGLFFTATAVLALILIPDKTAVLPYVVVLGFYGFIKAIAEKFTNNIVEWAIKIIYFNATLAIYLWLVLAIFLPNIVLPIPLWVLIIGAEVGFVIYDFIYSACIWYYEKQIRPKIKTLNSFR
ncbi:MAG: hypothetical protein RSB05_00895 [Clostridiales bacterium]